MGVDTTTYLPDAKVVYGAVQEQVSTLPAVMNLFGDGSKFGKPINNVGIRGYTFLARVKPNWNMGYRPEGTTGVGVAGHWQRVDLCAACAGRLDARRRRTDRLLWAGLAAFAVLGVVLILFLTSRH